MSIKQSISRFFTRKEPEPTTQELVLQTGTFRIMGVSCQVKDGLINLTDLWKAHGDPNKRNHPNVFLRSNGTSDFVDKCAKSLKVDKNELLSIQRGSQGGTFAHWQIALAYAKWLSPEFHLQVNDVYRRVKQADPTIAESIIDRTENVEDLKRIEARVRNRQSNVGLNNTIADCGGKAKTCAFVANNNNVAITGKTAKELRKEHNLPDKASTRPFLETDQMIDMAFLERLERKSLEKLRPKGHDAILVVCNCAIETVKDALSKHI